LLATFKTDEISLSDIEATSNVDYFQFLDHKKIHAECQAKKAQDLAELSPFGNSSQGWKVGNKDIPFTEATYLGKRRGIKYYGYIDKKYSGADYDAFRSALKDKAFAKRAEGVSGVKAFKGIFEIKIKGNRRLFTDKVYENELKQRLIYFDREGNHTAVDDFVKLRNRQKAK
jgi:hypothetical protein